MLNSTEHLNQLAVETGQLLSELNKASQVRGKTSSNELVKSFFEAKTRVKLLEAINDILDENPSHELLLRNLRREVLSAPVEHLPLIKALIRFEYIVAGR